MNYKTKLAFLSIVLMISLATTQDMMDDVGVYQIVTPIGIIHEGNEITPSVLIKNFGTDSESFTVSLMFAGYSSSREITDLDPGKTTAVNFDNWTADEPGTYTMVVNTQLEGDQNETNDIMQDTFQVINNLHDVGITSIQGPAGMIPQGTPVTPMVTVENFGTESENFNVTLLFNDYTNAKPVAGLDPGTTVNITFDYWTADAIDNYTTTAYTNLDLDENPNNDTAHGSFEVVQSLHDVGVTSILTPVGEISRGMAVIPNATVSNFGTQNETFNVIFEIDGYTSTQEITDLAPGEMATVNFDSWTPEQTGNKTLKVYTNLAGDQVPGNDGMNDSITVNP